MNLPRGDWEILDETLEDRLILLQELREQVSHQHQHIAELAQRIQALESAHSVVPEINGRIAYDSGGD